MSTPFDYKTEDAFHGPVGELVRRLEPCVPINILALYCQLLVAIGTIVGRRAVIRYIADEHFPNLFLIMVGETGCGKGTSWNVINRIAAQIYPEFSSLVPTDSASAPGLIALVRDPSIKSVNGKNVKDDGVTDKRRLVLFEEMETLFTAMNRQGSTLDQTWRLAWAGRTLENNSKNPERATNPHLSTICHITPEAFRDEIAARGRRSVTNGFINRFLIVPVARVRRIHIGSDLPDVGDLVDRIRNSLQRLCPVQPNPDAQEIRWATEAHQEWEAFCDAIDNEDSFLDGVKSAYGRLKPMVMRVGMLLAVIDGESQISLAHLRAAKALCLHLVDSSRDFFTTTTARRSRSARDRLMDFRTHGDFGLTDLHEWMKTHFPKGRLLSNDELHQLIDRFVSEGIWRVVHRTDNLKHRNWRFALADVCGKLASDEEQPINSPAKPEEPCIPPEEQAYYLGASFPVLNEIGGLTLEDKPVAVQRGKTGHLVQLHTASTGPLHKRLRAFQELKRHHRLVEIEGRLLLLPLKQVLAWAEAAQTKLQVA